MTPDRHPLCCCGVAVPLQVVHVPNRGIWGTAGIDGANIDTGIANDGDYLKVNFMSDVAPAMPQHSTLVCIHAAQIVCS
jgi:hypothetical protein